jgi:four helix bundle protein
LSKRAGEHDEKRCSAGSNKAIRRCGDSALRFARPWPRGDPGAGAATSVGANYREASRARSNNEFIAKIEQCAQEADEAQYWLELLREDCGVNSEFLNQIWTEADELIQIFVTMSKNTKSKG